MKDDPFDESLLNSAQLAHQLRLLLADVAYVYTRGYAIDAVGDALSEAEERCLQILSEIQSLQERVSVVMAIDSMARVSCGD